MKITVTKDAETAQDERWARHALMHATPQQIDDYIDANVTDLASAKAFLKVLTKVLVFGLRAVIRRR